MFLAGIIMKKKGQKKLAASGTKWDITVDPSDNRLIG